MKTKIFTFLLMMMLCATSALAEKTATVASSDSEGFSYINDFTYASDLISSNGQGGFSSTQNPSLGMLKANVFCVENFYGLSEGQSYATFNVYKNTSLVNLGQFNFCWNWYKLSLGEGSSKSFSFTDAYDNMNVGDTKVITSDEGTVYTFKLIDKITSSTNSKKKIVFSVDRPLYFGGSKNGSTGINNFRSRVQIKYADPNNNNNNNNNSFTGPTDITQYTDNGIEKAISNNNNIDIPMAYLAYEKNSCGGIMNCIRIISPSGVEHILYSQDLYSSTSDESIIPYLYELNGYIYIDLQSIEAGTWHLVLVQKYAGNWLYYLSTPKYTITTTSTNPSWGSATGGTTADYLSSITISATANSGYHFTQWNDGNTENPRTVTVTGDATYTASFEINIYTLKVISENNQIGMVMGSGKYEAFTEVNVMAAACKEGYKWSHWSDGVNLAGRKVVLTSDTTLVAHFTDVEESCIEVDANDQSLGQADILIMAIPNVGAHFVEWSDGDKSNPRVVTDLAPTKYIAIFANGSNLSPIASSPAAQEDNTSKYIRNSHIYIRRGDKTYTLTGQEIR